MAITTTSDKTFVVDLLDEAFQGVLTQKDALMGSVLVSSGAVAVSADMPVTTMNGRKLQIGEQITIPYFGRLGSFEDRTETGSLTPQKLAATDEQSTFLAAGMAFEVSRWAQAVGTMPDPYAESARQVQEELIRKHDDTTIATALTTPLVEDEYSAGAPQLLTPQLLMRARQRAWGDKGVNLVGYLMHSATVTDLRTLQDGLGRPLITDDYVNDQVITRFLGAPVVESDRCPINGSTQETPVEADGATATAPTVTLAGTPLAPYQLRIRNTAGTTLGSSTTIQFSVDGGGTWSTDLVVADTSAIALTDTTTDSLIGSNGATGLTAAFSAAFTGTDNVWGSNTLVQASTFALQRDSMAYWYAGSHIGLQTDTDILKDSDIASVHLYYSSHLYRRTPEMTRPGVLRVIHNVTDLPAFTAVGLDALDISP